MNLTHGSLFSGIGGFDLAAEWMGWDNVFHCEWNAFGKKILKYYWPGAISYADIKKTDFHVHRGAIDILSGGFPCQPYSVAGRRKGTEDDRHLWPEMLRAIREIQPYFVVGENVSGLVNWSGGMVFEQVQADLEAEGYEVTSFLLPAAGINAPHKRERIWFVAHANSSPRRRPNSTGEEKNKAIWTGLHKSASRPCAFGASSNASSQYSPVSIQQRQQDTAENLNVDWQNESRNVADTKSQGLQGATRVQKQKAGRFTTPGESTQWASWPTQSPICNGNDGFSAQLDGITFSKWRNESVKGGGNAIVPELAFQIFTTIQKFILTI